MFISGVESCENIMLTLIKSSTKRYCASFTTHFCNVSITGLQIGKNINLKIKKRDI